MQSCHSQQVGWAQPAPPARLSSYPQWHFSWASLCAAKKWRCFLSREVWRASAERGSCDVPRTRVKFKIAAIGRPARKLFTALNWVRPIFESANRPIRFDFVRGESWVLLESAYESLRSFFAASWLRGIWRWVREPPPVLRATQKSEHALFSPKNCHAEREASEGDPRGGRLRPRGGVASTFPSLCCHRLCRRRDPPYPSDRRAGDDV